MKDLSALASKHEIEGKLYEGGGLGKVISLIGYARHKHFRSLNLATTSKNIEWEKLMVFLNQELQLIERMVLDSCYAQRVVQFDNLCNRVFNLNK